MAAEPDQHPELRRSGDHPEPANLLQQHVQLPGLYRSEYWTDAHVLRHRQQYYGELVRQRRQQQLQRLAGEGAEPDVAWPAVHRPLHLVESVELQPGILRSQSPCSLRSRRPEPPTSVRAEPGLPVAIWQG